MKEQRNEKLDKMKPRRKEAIYTNEAMKKIKECV